MQPVPMLSPTRRKDFFTAMGFRRKRHFPPKTTLFSCTNPSFQGYFVQFLAIKRYFFAQDGGGGVFKIIIIFAIENTSGGHGKKHERKYRARKGTQKRQPRNLKVQ